jgi:hypothetical protein
MPNPIRGLTEGLRSSQRRPVSSTGPDDGDAEWPQQVAASGLRMQPLTALLGIALIAVLGIWGGAELEKRQGSGTSAPSTARSSAFAARTAGATGQGGFTGAPSGASNGASGTVTVVTGKMLYLTSSSGAIVKVELTAKTTYTRTAKSAATGLKPGDSAIVQGAENAAGVTVATSVTATAKGVTVAARGFGGGFGATSGTKAPGG